MKMSVCVMKNLLCLLIICGQYFSCVTSCFFLVRSWNLHITNGMSQDPQTQLRIHVYSEKDNLGFHNLTYNGPEYFLHFCETLSRTTVFTAYFWHGDTRSSLYLFNDEVEAHFAPIYKPLIKTQNIYWLVKDDGFYLSGKKDSGYVFWVKW
ncbi:hypothetical protein R6Q59_018651 [Mikania micrantha]